MMNIQKLILALIAIGVTVGFLWISHRPVIPAESTWEDVVDEAKNGGYRLITTDDLSREYQRQSDEILLIDTRQEWEYRSGHIRGALNFPMEPSWISRWKNKKALQSVLGSDKNRLIVFY